MFINYYLNAINILVDDYECSLKTFRVELTAPDGPIVDAGTFVRRKYEDNPGFQEFKMKKKIKFYLIDNLGEQGGNFILIKRILFNVRN